MTPKSGKFERNIAHFLMSLLVCFWSFDYIAAKHIIGTVDPTTLIFMKYTLGFVFVCLFKLIRDRKRFRIRKGDIPVLVICAITGEILYYNFDYTAMTIMPISLVTIVLAFVPMVSIVLEWIFYKRRPTAKLVAFLLLCIAGVSVVIGADLSILFQGRMLGYILSFAAVFSWNAYNFLTAKLTDHYSAINLIMLQLLCTILLTMPYGIYHVSDIGNLTPVMIGGILYLGLFSTFLGFFVYVWSLARLGPTTNAIYSNFLPVVSTVFGFFFLGEMIKPMQIVGGIVVVFAGYMTIREKGKQEEKIRNAQDQYDDVD